jgi:release factor glutamine methyltransferase
LIASVAARLAAAGCVAPDDEARELRHDAPDEQELEARVRRREAGEPLAWITGRVVFAGSTLHVAPGVYVPRRQSETLARRAATRLPPRGIAVDLCTGSGAIAAVLRGAAPDALIVGVDVDPAAARCAARNGVPAVVGDLAAPLYAQATVDVVTAVAPYVPTAARRLLPADVQRHEPAHALDGGDDGLAVVRRVVEHAAALLRPGGHLLVELGGEQDAALARDLARHGFEPATVWHDEDGDLRGLIARRAASTAPDLAKR